MVRCGVMACCLLGMLTVFLMPTLSEATRKQKRGSVSLGASSRAAYSSLRHRGSRADDGTPIEGSGNWWSCSHGNMHTCGEQCCCAKDFTYDEVLEECVQLPEHLQPVVNDTDMTSEAENNSGNSTDNSFEPATNGSDSVAEAGENGAAQNGTTINETVQNGSTINETAATDAAVTNESQVVTDASETNGTQAEKNETKPVKEAVETNETKVGGDAEKENQAEPKEEAAAERASEVKEEVASPAKSNSSAAATTAMPLRYDEEGYAEEWRSEWKRGDVSA